MTLMMKIIKGDRKRKSRLHDEKGNFATWKNIVLHSGPAIASGILRVATGFRPEIPWIAYTSIRYLRGFLNKNCRVLEFGSGMSTIWFAKHAMAIYSVENSRFWYDKISRIIERDKLTNVTYRFAASEMEYSTFMANDKQGFDLILVDGRYRSKCIRHAKQLVRPGGILYLDNSDIHSTPKGGDMRIAETHARKVAESSGAEILEITDFQPTQFVAQQGLLIKFPG